MNIVFAGTPEFSIPALDSVAEAYNVSAVLTAPDLPKGRGRKLAPSPVAKRAAELGIDTLKFLRLGREAREVIASYTPDLLLAVAYGRIFGPKFLALFGYGGLNVHPSLLPKFRGPAPIPAAILAGDPKTGVTVQEIALEMDAGDIICQSSIALSGDETTGTLSESCARLGAKLLVDAVGAVIDGTIKPIRQNEEDATYCSLIEKEAGCIDWTLSADAICRMVRAYSPWPSAYTTLRDKRLSILSARVVTDAAAHGSDTVIAALPGMVVDIDKQAGILVQTGSGYLAVDHLQLQSKKPNFFRDFLNGQPGGAKAFVGVQLGAEV